MRNLAQKLQNLPQKPGVYLFRDRKGEVLYVGKAKNLKNRVRSYFQNGRNHLPRTDLMLKEVADLKYIIVSSEIESLILENNLIKQYRPRFNVRLRDDKNYQFLKIDYDSEIPQVYPVRRITPSSSPPYQGGEKRGNRYFGPFTSALSVKHTLKLLRRIFHLCSNKKVGSKPCFHYHLGRCPGVCIGQVSLENYRQTFKGIEEFLNHKQGQILKELKVQMRRAAAEKQFEKAAVIRDKIAALQNIWQKQKIVSPRKLSEDYFSLFLEGQAIVSLFLVRDGKLIHQENFELEYPEGQAPPKILGEFLKQYYADASNIPTTVVTSYDLPEKNLLEKWLKLKILKAQKGKKLQLLKLGEENARDYYEKNFAAPEKVLGGLQALLKLPRLPARIEAYDISNIQGFLPVGSMVVFEAGLPKKSDYRKFKINSRQTPDDFAMMKEVLNRRFKRIIDNRSSIKDSNWPLPDLIIIDGGKGQLAAALEALQIQNPRSKIPTIALAKKLEEIFIPGRKEGMILPADSPILFLLQRIRDEAHRFAITFYRSKHRKEETRSRLDEVAGIGPITKKKLLNKFGTVSAMRAASLEALAESVGMATAKKIKENL